VYCRTLLSSPPTTVTVLGNTVPFFHDTPFSLSGTSVCAVKQRLELMWALLEEY
jgi:hypothetical protein